MAARLPFTLRPDAVRRLILLEDGADFAPAVDNSWEETIAMAQLSGESPSDFAERALHRIATIERSGRCIRRAELHTAATDAPPALAARRLIALGIAAHAENTQVLDELVISAPAHASWDQRISLLELTDELLLAADRTPLAVRLRFRQLELPPEHASDPVLLLPEPLARTDVALQHELRPQIQS